MNSGVIHIVVLIVDVVDKRLKVRVFEVHAPKAEGTVREGVQKRVEVFAK